MQITVKDALDTDEISLGLKVLYNDSTHKYWSAETGTVVKASEDGQYTVKFDCNTDLSDAAVKAGITNLDKLTAIYIKDENVDNGSAKASPLDSCNITIDKVVLDGQTLTLNSLAAAKEAVKNGVFDSGNPVNAWDGSAVDEVKASDHVALFTTNTAHKVIEITFTLSGMKFKTPTTGIEHPAEKIEAVGDTTINICPDSNADSFELKVKVTPAETENVVTFISGDESILRVPTKAVSVDENGYASVEVQILKNADTTITALTDNGLSVEYEIKREHDYVEISRVDAKVGVEGLITYECTECHKQKTETIPAIDEDKPEITLGTECKPIDGKTPSATITDKDFPSSEGAKGVKVDITIPDSAKEKWNDWCGNIIRVTDKDGVHYYMWGGSGVTWDKDIDGDKVNEITGGSGGSQWLGTVVDGKVSLYIPVAGDEFTIDFITDCYVSDGVPTYDGVIYVIEKATLLKENVTPNPSDPSGPSGPSKPEGPVDTGDGNMPGVLIIALAVSAATCVTVMRKRKTVER